MTVKELIEKLKEFGEYAPLVASDTNDIWSEIINVKIDNITGYVVIEVE